ncbi:MAG: T9SS type A sorting domain-containing protein [Bacteroidetes bacterium]|nr:T9SS type A sorting domain-containing protein [Bacteroidota bacterium]
MVITGICANTFTLGGSNIQDSVVNSVGSVPAFIARFDTAGHFIDIHNGAFNGKVFITSQGDYFVSGGIIGVRVNALGVTTATFDYALSSQAWVRISGITLDKNDNVYMSGFITNSVTIGGTPVTHTNVPQGLGNSIIVKFSPTGSLLWYKTSNPSGGGGDVLGKCTLDTSGTKVITGGVASLGITVFGYTLPPPQNTARANVFYVFDTNTGNLLSAYTATTQYQDFISPAYTSKDDTIYCTGTINGYLAFNTATYTTNPPTSTRQNCIAKFHASVGFINASLLPQAGSSAASIKEAINGIDMDNQGNIYICGMFGGTLDSLGTAVNIIGGAEDGFVAKFGYPCGSAPTNTIPNVPLALTAVNNGSLTNNVVWTDNSNNESNFDLHYTFGGNPTYSLLATLPANTTSYAHTGLSYTTTYCYKVAATNSIGTSAFSNTDCATTPAPPTATSTPNAPLNLTALNNGSLTNNVAWNDNSNDETNFELHYTIGSSATYSLLATLPPNTTSYAHTGLSYTTTYCYKVAATNSVGSSAFSNTACATTPAAEPPLRVKEQTLLNSFVMVYPNPTSGTVWLSCLPLKGESVIEVISPLGQLLQRIVLPPDDGHTLPYFRLIELPNIKGVYLIKVSSSLSGAMVSKKVAVE